MKILVFIICICASVYVQAQCCELNKVYTNTRLPDVTSVVDYIHAGNYSFNPGNVNVMPGENINFVAGNEITLDPGFTVHEGGKFTAEIGPCSSAPVAVFPMVTLRPCNHTLSAIVCPATVPVSYLWSTGAQSASIDVAPSQATPYWVKVTNLQTGQVIQKNFMISPDYFNATPSIALFGSNNDAMFNSFEPDGDGWHDIWYPRFDKDESNDHVRRKAYNAHYFKLTIYNRWGNIVSETEGNTAGERFAETAGEGFAETDIFWNGRRNNTGGFLPSATYYAILKLQSCSEVREWVGPITMINSSGRMADLEMENAEATPAISAYPNPARDVLNLDLPVLMDGTYSIKLVDPLGQVVMEEKSNGGLVNLSVSHLKGLHLIKVSGGMEDYSSKILLNE